MRKARTRSPHALLTVCLDSGIKIYHAVRLGQRRARSVSGHLRLFPFMRSGVGDRILEISSISARISARGGNARSFDNWYLSQAAGAGIEQKVD